MGILKQSTARNRLFLMVDSADHITGKTGLTVALTLSKNAGAFAAAGGAVTEIGSGWYSVALNTTDTNTLGDLAYHATATGADPTDWSDEVSARLLDDLVQTSALPANFSALSISAAGLVDILQTAADKVWSTATRALTDKVGFALSAAGVQAIWDALTSALTTANSIGKRLADDIDATISSRGTSTYAGTDTAGTTTLLGRLTAGRATNLDNLDATVSSRSTLTAANVWDYLTSAATTVDSLGKLVVDNLNATITSVKALLPAALVGGRIDASVGANQAGVITAAAHATGAIDANALATDAVNEIRDAVTSAAVDGTTTLAQSLRLQNAALGGKSSGHATGAPVYRDLADTKNRIAATTDADGNRSAVTTDLS